MSEPKKFDLLEGFNTKNNKLINFLITGGYLIALKVKSKDSGGTKIYVSRLMTEPLKDLLSGKAKVNLTQATLKQLNSKGWQRLGDF